MEQIYQVTAFYIKHSLSNYYLQKIRVTPEEVAQAQAMVDAVRVARQQHKYSRGEAQQFTQTSQEALQALHAWMQRFFKIATVALEGQAQMLEALSMVVKA